MNAPLLPGDRNTVEVNGSTATDVDLKGALGVVQAFTDIRGAPCWPYRAAVTGTLVDTSFEYIRNLPNRWATLTGDVVATGAAGETVNLTVREGGGLVNEYPRRPMEVVGLGDVGGWQRRGGSRSRGLGRVPATAGKAVTP